MLCAAPRVATASGRAGHSRRSQGASAQLRAGAGGAAVLGTNAPMIAADFEGPVSRKTVRDLWWEVGAISVAQFRRFVAATGYVTVAERLGCSFVFHTHVPAGPKTLWAWLV